MSETLIVLLVLFGLKAVKISAHIFKEFLLSLGLLLHGRIVKCKLFINFLSL